MPTVFRAWAIQASSLVVLLLIGWVMRKKRCFRERNNQEYTTFAIVRKIGMHGQVDDPRRRKSSPLLYSANVRKKRSCLIYLQPLCATGDGRAPEAVCAAKYVSSGSKKKLLLVAPLQGAFPIVYILASCLSVTDQPVLLATGAKNCCSRRRHKATHRPKQTLQPIEPTSKRFPHNGHCFSSPSSHLWRENKTKLKHLVESLVAYSFLLCEQTRHQPFHVAATFAPSPLRTRNRRHARLA